jgi:hypothetical protein
MIHVSNWQWNVYQDMSRAWHLINLCIFDMGFEVSIMIVVQIIFLFGFLHHGLRFIPTFCKHFMVHCQSEWMCWRCMLNS